MAWNVDQLYKSVLFLIRKNQGGGLSDVEFFYAWNMEQSAYQSDLLGRFQSRTNSKEGLNTGLIENETIMTKLTPFTQTTPLTVTAGQAIKPIDFVYTLAIRINNAKCFQIDHDQIWSVLEDVIDPPSIAANSYYYTEYQNYYSILPAAVASMQLDYIQVVTDVKWGYTFDVNGRQVYDATSSVQPLWGQNSLLEITQRTLKTMGITFSAQDLEQAGKSEIITGD